MNEVRIRQATLDDLDAIAQLCASLWPACPIEEHASELRATLSGRSPVTLPLTIFVADNNGRVVGFVEADLRSHVDGCDPSRPTGYIEGWYVVPDARRRHIGQLLVKAAEDWARSQGCVEMGSDTWIDNETSQLAHEALGYEVVDRCVHYRKRL